MKKIGRALVVGAGVGGLRAALDLAGTGYGVTLIDRAAHPGGILAGLDRQFPTDHCGLCRLLPTLERDEASQYCLRKGWFHENIELRLETELAAVEGEAGRYTVTLTQPPKAVDPDLCMGCGECARVCPSKVPDEFNRGMSNRAAIYRPVPHAASSPYVIDRAACTRCGACEKVCPTGAIRLAGLIRDFRVLVVDDERILRESLKDWLDLEGYPVGMAASGQEALDELAARPYHLMLLDVKMPGLDGVETLRRAKALNPDLPVIMMTAYATVETAVEAMKIGALNYLVKPFHPQDLIPMVGGLYKARELERGTRLTVGAIVLSGGTGYFDPALKADLYGYGRYPGVVTHLEFERLLSGSGPAGGRLVRPGDGRPVKKIAWLQCVGSRDLALGADYCSSICCLSSIKEALWAKDRTGGEAGTAIFYMDLRACGPEYHRYRTRAETERGVRFIRSRIHSVVPDIPTGDLVLSFASPDGRPREERFDLVVLALGQRPARGTAELAALLNLDLNPWGFVRSGPLQPGGSPHPGISLAGSFAGLRDIHETVLQAGSAALAASRFIHAVGGSLAPVPEPGDVPSRDAYGETPRILALVCSCGGVHDALVPIEAVRSRLVHDPDAAGVEGLDRLCSAEGQTAAADACARHAANRVLIGACLMLAYASKTRELARSLGLGPGLVDVVDLRTLVNRSSGASATLPEESPGGTEASQRRALDELSMGLARLKWADPKVEASVPVTPRALVVGGGPAGLTAALAVADHGFDVDLVDRAEQLGGHLSWLGSTIDGQDLKAWGADLIGRVVKHPRIRVRTGTRVIASQGSVGRFATQVQTGDQPPEPLEHGAILLAVGGREARPQCHGYGELPAVITQREWAEKTHNKEWDPAALRTVVMIQCAGSREEPRNYCSRVCCAVSLKYALDLKSQNPEARVVVLYRDIMAYGFLETYYTQARKAGVLFIPYEVDRKPVVEAGDSGAVVTAYDPIARLDLRIDANVVILAAGMDSGLDDGLARVFGVDRNQDGFFRPVDPKWRPMEALREGVFACGAALGPRNVAETTASAEAAAMRVLEILNRPRLALARVSAHVRPAYCSLCERCVEACPFQARSVDEDLEVIVINPALCQGCGLCAAVCPNGAAVVAGYTQTSLLAEVDAAVEGAWA